MKIPKKIKIGAYEYKIERVKEIKYEEDYCHGLCDKEAKVIYLHKTLEGVKLLETFLHECTHAMEDSYKVKLSEKQVEVIGIGMTALIIDNKLDLRDAKNNVATNRRGKAHSPTSRRKASQRC